MINRSLLFTGLALLSAQTWAATKYELRGQLSTKLSHYTKETNENTGQKFYSQFEQVGIVSEHLSFINQARWNYSSIYTDVSNAPSVQAEDTHDLYPGENYVKYQSSNWVMQAGYQEISWGESFGFNFADFVNPQDQTMTLYFEENESKYPLLLVNLKYFFDFGSLQFLYSPEPRFNKTLPVNLFTDPSLSTIQINTRMQKSPNIFDENEYGGKLSMTLAGFDTALFYYDYLDRVPYYNIESASPTLVTLAEKHARIKSYGASIAKTLFDDYVFRADVVLNKDRIVNSVVTTPFGPNFQETLSDEMDVQISIDSPTYNRFSGAAIFARSTLSNLTEYALREKEETYAIGRLSYDFGEEKVFDLSYTHQFSHPGHAVQAILNWPVTDLVELRMGGETYWGNEESTLGKLENISNVFFGLKTYFNL